MIATRLPVVEILGLEHGAHAALADRADDAIAAGE